MNLERYELKAGHKLMTFRFVSKGPKGEIPKLIQFNSTNDKDVYNLAFGDELSTIGSFDDLVISDNGDSEKVLATVVAAIYTFTSAYPDAWIYATGSTNVRTRLYQMGISRNLKRAFTDFLIFGLQNAQWEPFVKGKNYEAFVVKRKFSNFEVV